MMCIGDLPGRIECLRPDLQKLEFPSISSRCPEKSAEGIANVGYRKAGSDFGSPYVVSPLVIMKEMQNVTLYSVPNIEQPA